MSKTSLKPTLWRVEEYSRPTILGKTVPVDFLAEAFGKKVSTVPPNGYLTEEEARQIARETNTKKVAAIPVLCRNEREV